MTTGLAPIVGHLSCVRYPGGVRAPRLTLRMGRGFGGDTVEFGGAVGLLREVRSLRINCQSPGAGTALATGCADCGE